MRRRILVGAVISAAPGLVLLAGSAWGWLHLIWAVLFWGWHAIRFPRAWPEPIVYSVPWAAAWIVADGLLRYSGRAFDPWVVVLFAIAFFVMLFGLAGFGLLVKFDRWAVRKRFHVTSVTEAVSRSSVDALRAALLVRPGMEDEETELGMADATGWIPALIRSPVVNAETGLLEVVESRYRIMISNETSDRQDLIFNEEDDDEPMVTIREFHADGEGSRLVVRAHGKMSLETCLESWLNDVNRDFAACLVAEAEGGTFGGIRREPMDTMTNWINRSFPAEPSAIDPPADGGDPPSKRGPWG